MCPEMTWPTRAAKALGPPSHAPPQGSFTTLEAWTPATCKKGLEEGGSFNARQIKIDEEDGGRGTQGLKPQSGPTHVSPHLYTLHTHSGALIKSVHIHALMSPCMCTCCDS